MSKYLVAAFVCSALSLIGLVGILPAEATGRYEHNIFDATSIDGFPKIAVQTASDIRASHVPSGTYLCARDHRGRGATAEGNVSVTTKTTKQVAADGQPKPEGGTDVAKENKPAPNPSPAAGPSSEKPVSILNTLGEFGLSSSVMTICVLICVLTTCLLCIYMVFFFGRRLQSTAFVRDSLIESAKEQELKVLLRGLLDEAMAGPLDPKDPPPIGYLPRQLWDPSFPTASGPMPVYYSNSSESDEEKAARLKEQEERRQRLEDIRKWGSAEKARFEERRAKLEKVALERAEKRVPKSMDISLLGGGFAFLLEFSTVIVIIFTVLIFGILDKLEGKEISTILAAIAGYVLGKASSAAKEQEKPVGGMTGSSASIGRSTN